MSETQTRDRVVPASIATPSCWNQVRAIDNNGVIGEWYECEQANRSLYIREMNGVWTVGLYKTKTAYIIQREKFDSATDAASYLGKLAWDTQH